MKKSLILVFMLIFLVSISFSYSWVYFAENTAFNPINSNVTYIVPAGGLNATSVGLGNNCLNVTGGTYEGNYCQTADTPTNITLGFSSVANIKCYNEETLNLMTIEADIQIVNDQTSQVYNLNFTGFQTLDIAIGNYSVYYTADDFVQREYYFTNDGFTSFNLDLYFLNETKSTLIIYTLYDENSKPVEDILIKVQRYYPSTDTYQTVSMTKTNYEGEAILYGVLYDIFYKMIYINNEGNILKTTTPSKFFESRTSDLVVLAEDPLQSFRTYQTVSFNVGFYNLTNTTYARFIYSDINNIVREGCLKVDFISPSVGIENICYTCINSTSATLTCEVDTTREGEFIAIGIIDTNTQNSWYNLGIDYLDTSKAFAFAQQGLFLGTIFAGTLALMGISTISGSIVFLMLGIILMGIVGLIGGLGWVVIATFVVIGFIFIFIVRQRT